MGRGPGPGRCHAPGVRGTATRVGGGCSTGRWRDRAGGHTRVGWRIRERFRVKRQMRVVSAHGRITGWILVCLPPALGIALTAINQEHRELMFGETLGIQMMIGAAVLQTIGALIIRKIINIPY